MKEIRIYYENKNNGNFEHIKFVMPDNVKKLYKAIIVETKEHNKVIDTLERKK